MRPSSFISSKLDFKGWVAVTAIAISFLVIILAVAISSGFRREIRDGVSRLMGDVQLTTPQINYYTDASPVNLDSLNLETVSKIKGVKNITPVVYRAGIVKNGEEIQGVLVKGIPSSDTTALGVSIPTVCLQGSA